ncbi:hypothetical protein POSPLADRAFT_1052022 [Postia placenta MAD-698-R-SB12]|uniref:Uncharacterized protein n=1 Tax=Postia placenta MAD-698-R-SB12 TaxID=670580 RepID=A0A1X6NHR8_9APHY|nr:hypothetical protein POSPLADRAFT_1052022 [Postia placenta MAD-698-R-SB12]OSX67913.1 hypothetical protein POSPLADRAFT_1052022 [Postia placenta MAD-698-R-SB12]
MAFPKTLFRRSNRSPTSSSALGVIEVASAEKYVVLLPLEAANKTGKVVQQQAGGIAEMLDDDNSAWGPSSRNTTSTRS